MAKPRSLNSLCLGSNLLLIGETCYHTQKSLRMSAEYSSFAGWEKNLKLSNSFAEVIVTLDVGPRIISYRPAKGRTVFKLVNDQAGKSGEEEWKIRGGHRLWTAPEDFGKDDSFCYALDNSEVEHAIGDDFTGPGFQPHREAGEDPSGNDHQVGGSKPESDGRASNCP